jgi:hypothetical protein
VINYKYGGQITNELNNKEEATQVPFGQLLVNYFLDITEEEYVDMSRTVQAQAVDSGEMVDIHPAYTGYPYRAMKQVMISNMLPTLIWNVTITPIKAHYTLTKESVSDFLVRLCGIIGGIFAAATIFESIVRNGLCIILPFGDNDEADGPKPESVARKK